MRKHIIAVVVALVASALAPAVSTAATPNVSAQTGSVRRQWSDPSTWGGSLPTDGSVVEIPVGSTVVLDVSPPELKGLHVDGTLVFGNTDLRLRSDYIMVHGKLKAGSSKAPYTHNATITLTQENRDANVMGMGGRLLGVMGGTVELFGKARTSWTQLDATAPSGARAIQVAEDVDWRPGDRIAIASTDYWASHAEEAVITSVEGRTVRLDRALEYAHFGELQHYGGKVLDERAEVALLSRNITIRGADDSSTDGFGGQMMIEHGGRVKLRGVEFTDMGQTARLRRYPIHFHMDGSADGSFIKNSAIHGSFNRCITVHGTDDLLVADNVCYDHVGHGFFLEDGAETDNVFRGNLGFRTREPKRDPLLPTDRDPATFWITNPDNRFVGNHAAGSDGFGFWYALPEHPTGLSAGSKNIWPRRTPLKEFRGNTAHSNASDGLFVDRGPRPDGQVETTWYEPKKDPTDEESEDVVATFEDFTAYKNRDRGVWLRGENHVITGSMFADNRAAATFASAESFLENSVVVGFSANKGTAEDWEDTAPDGRELPFFWEPESPIHGFEFYDGRVGVSNTAFYDFQGDRMRPAGALGYLEPDAFSIDPENFARDVSFERSTRVHLSTPEPDMDGDLSKVILDADGSVTGTAGAAIVVDNPFLLNDSCNRKDEWNAYVCRNAEYVSFMAGSLDYEPADIKPVTLTRSDGVKQKLHGCCDDSSEAWTSVFAKDVLGVDFAARTTKGVRFVIRNAARQYVIVKLQQPAGFKVSRWGWPVDQVGSRAALNDHSESAYFYESGTNTLFVRVDGDGSYWNEIQVRPN